MEDNMEKEIPLGRYFKVMFHKKITLLAISLGTLLVGCLGLKFAINPGKKVYKAEYKYTVSGFNNNGSYIDGTKFYFNDLISLETLTKIRDSKEEYKGIKVDKMLEKNSIDIQIVTEYNDNKEVIDRYYSLRALQTYFKDDKQAKSFFMDIMNYPIEKNKELQDNINYTINLENYDEVDFFNLQIAYLNNQYDLISSKYSNLIDNYGDITLKDGQKLSNKKMELDMYFTNNTFAVLGYELNQKGYVKDYDRQKDKLEIQKKEYQDEIDRNNAMITELSGIVDHLITTAGSNAQSFDLNSYNSKITELVVRNSELNKAITEIQRQIDNGQVTPTSFTAKLDTYKTKLTAETTKYRAIEKEVVEENSKWFSLNTNVIERTGGISMVIGAAGSLVGGLVIACIVNLIIDHKYLYEDFPAKVEKKKEEEVKE